MAGAKASDLVAAVVAPGRSVQTEAGISGPGEEVLLDAEDAERLTALGFLVPSEGKKPKKPVKGGVVTDAENGGASVTVTEG